MKPNPNNIKSHDRGRFITFEGIDGAGKSTHLGWFAERLSARIAPRQVVLTREPGGTPLGERLREILLNEPMHPDTEALLMFAARREHLSELIEPVLERGDWVLSDRFTDSSFAYQGGGRGVSAGRLGLLEQFTHAHLAPDRTVLFDLDPEVARQRRSGVRVPDKFEAEAAAFHRRTRLAYLDRARSDPERFAIVDTSGTISDIHKILEEIILSL